MRDKGKNSNKNLNYHLKELAKERNIPYGDDFVKQYLDEYDKIPMWLDEDKVKEYEGILSEIQECVINHCKEKGIRFSADYHQYGEYGVPIIDDKYMFFTFARTWGRIMAEADDDYSDKGYLKYYLHGNEHPTKYPNEVESEVVYE